MGIKRQAKGASSAKGGQFVSTDRPDDQTTDELSLGYKFRRPKGETLREKSYRERDIQSRMDSLVTDMSFRKTLQEIVEAKEVLESGIDMPPERVYASREMSLANSLSSLRTRATAVQNTVSQYLDFCKERRIEPDLERIPDLEAVSKIQTAAGDMSYAMFIRLEEIKKTSDYDPLECHPEILAKTVRELDLPADLNLGVEHAPWMSESSRAST